MNISRPSIICLVIFMAGAAHPSLAYGDSPTDTVLKEAAEAHLMSKPSAAPYHISRHQALIKSPTTTTADKYKLLLNLSVIHNGLGDWMSSLVVMQDLIALQNAGTRVIDHIRLANILSLAHAENPDKIPLSNVLSVYSNVMSMVAGNGSALRDRQVFRRWVDLCDTYSILLRKGKKFGPQECKTGLDSALMAYSTAVSPEFSAVHKYSEKHLTVLRARALEWAVRSDSIKVLTDTLQTLAIANESELDDFWFRFRPVWSDKLVFVRFFVKSYPLNVKRAQCLSLALGGLIHGGRFIDAAEILSDAVSMLESQQNLKKDEKDAILAELKMIASHLKGSVYHLSKPSSTPTSNNN